VGSDRSAIRNSIANELSTEPVATLVLSASQGADGLTVHYQAGNKIKDSRLLIAVVQKNAQSNVLRGENAGHKLSHVQVVRQLQNESFKRRWRGETLWLLCHKALITQGWEVLGLIQDPATGKITAAAKAEFNDNNIVKTIRA
jgi:hypothetical protein